MRAVGLGKHIFGSPFLASQGYTHEASVDDLETPKQPTEISVPTKSPLEGPGLVSTIVAAGTVLAAMGYAIFSLVKK